MDELDRNLLGIPYSLSNFRVTRRILFPYTIPVLGRGAEVISTRGAVRFRCEASGKGAWPRGHWGNLVRRNRGGNGTFAVGGQLERLSTVIRSLRLAAANSDEALSRGGSPGHPVLLPSFRFVFFPRQW